MTPSVLIVEARFYPHIADALLEGAKHELEKKKVPFEVIAVPGALEIPTAIALASRSTAKFYDGYVALGCVIRGETFHFEIVAMESARGLAELGVKNGLAIGNGILTVENEAQALKRAAPNDGDKGGDAARACLALIEVRARLKQS
jgi:6,7-dimethyl-8-ribityllumazine synthase